MILATLNKINIIKSSKKKEDATFEEIIFFKCINNNEVIQKLNSIQKKYDDDPLFETLHTLQDHLSISFRHKISLQEVRFYASD